MLSPYRHRANLRQASLDVSKIASLSSLSHRLPLIDPMKSFCYGLAGSIQCQSTPLSLAPTSGSHDRQTPPANSKAAANQAVFSTSALSCSALIMSQYALGSNSAMRLTEQSWVRVRPPSQPRFGVYLVHFCGLGAAIGDGDGLAAGL